MLFYFLSFAQSIDFKFVFFHNSELGLVCVFMCWYYFTICIIQFVTFVESGLLLESPKMFWIIIEKTDILIGTMFCALLAIVTGLHQAGVKVKIAFLFSDLFNLLEIKKFFLCCLVICHKKPPLFWYSLIAFALTYICAFVLFCLSVIGIFWRRNSVKKAAQISYKFFVSFAVCPL